jgi:phosphate transport system substrate-binding protein
MADCHRGVTSSSNNLLVDINATDRPATAGNQSTFLPLACSRTKQFPLEIYAVKKSLLPCILGIFLAIIQAETVSAADAIAGAGSSAAAPVYKIWADEYRKVSGELIAYDPVGSGAGMTRIRQHQVDFGASDVIASRAELSRDGLIMFPTVISGVVPVVNLAKLGTPVKLNGEVLARIFLGEITQWNAPEIAALNPKLSLPNLAIQVVCRSDSSGTTYHFSDYLAKVSANWKTRYGVANKHSWPASFTSAKGSSEVSRTVRSTPGSIGYIDYSYIVEDGLTGVLMQNSAGHFVAASPNAFRSAVLKSQWFSSGDFSETLTNMTGENSWPITMGTYVAVQKSASDAQRSARTLRFFVWALSNQSFLAGQAKFVPLPDKVQAKVFREISSVVGNTGELIGVGSISVLAKAMSH